MKYAITVKFEGQLVDRFAVRAVSAEHALRKAVQIMVDRQWKDQTVREMRVYRMTFTANAKDCPADLPVIPWKL